MPREILKGERITDRDMLRLVVWNDAEGYEVVKEVNGGNSRWHQHIDTIFRRLSDGKLFIVYWRKAATENQDHEYPDEAVECEAYTETVTKYRRK
jgi:hypothetical protein